MNKLLALLFMLTLGAQAKADCVTDAVFKNADNYGNNCTRDQLFNLIRITTLFASAAKAHKMTVDAAIGANKCPTAAQRATYKQFILNVSGGYNLIGHLQRQTSAGLEDVRVFSNPDLNNSSFFYSYVVNHLINIFYVPSPLRDIESCFDGRNWLADGSAPKNINFLKGKLNNFVETISSFEAKRSQLCNTLYLKGGATSDCP